MTQTHQQDDDHNDAAHSKHDHGDAGHQRSHGTGASERRLVIALAILGSFTLVEAVGGYFSNSIALLAEAAHMLTDSASLFLAIVAIRVGRRPAHRDTRPVRHSTDPGSRRVREDLLVVYLWTKQNAAVLRRFAQGHLLHPA